MIIENSFFQNFQMKNYYWLISTKPKHLLCRIKNFEHWNQKQHVLSNNHNASTYGNVSLLFQWTGTLPIRKELTPWTSKGILNINAMPWLHLPNKLTETCHPFYEKQQGKIFLVLLPHVIEEPKTNIRFLLICHQPKKLSTENVTHDDQISKLKL